MLRGRDRSRRKSKESTQGGGERLRIRNPELLAEALQRIIDTLGPSVHAVAKEYGMSQPQLAKLLGRRRRGLTTRTYHELLWLAACARASSEELRDHIKALHGLFLVGGDLAASGTDWLHSPEVLAVLASVYGPKERGVVRSYDRWIEKQIFHFLGVELGLTLEERERLGRLAESKPRLKRAVEKLQQVIRRRNHEPSRMMVAFVTAIAPLNHYFATSGVERGFRELKDDELAKFVALGLERERLLLDRKHDSARAQVAAAFSDELDKERTERLKIFERAAAQSFVPPWWGEGSPPSS